MSHVVLLGDSIFDNARYVSEGVSVIEHLRRILPKDWRATLLARDGSVASDVAGQLERLPADATRLVVSVGGNDALGCSGDLLREPPGLIAGALARLASVRSGFQQDYRRMLQRLAACGKPTTLCTIYDAIPGLEPGDAAALSLFNDVIVREAFRTGADLIDLRLVCTEAADYSLTSPIEPSAIGGGKIARTVSRAVVGREGQGEGVRIFF